MSHSDSRPFDVPPTEGEVVDFDALKFLALDRFLATFKQKSSFKGGDLEELQYDFLERCDGVVQSTVHGFLNRDLLFSVADEAFRERLASCVDLISDCDDEAPGYGAMECLDLLEQLEDSATAWLSAALLSRSTLATLYRQLDRLSRKPTPGGSSDRLSRLFCDLIDQSLLLDGEEKSRFKVRVQHGTTETNLHLLNRFLQAHLEYGEVLQNAILEQHPELMTRVWLNLVKEAEKGVARKVSRSK